MSCSSTSWRTRAEIALAALIGLVALWALLIIPVGVVAFILVPSPDYTVGDFIRIAGLLVLSLTSLSVIGYCWARRRSESESWVLGKKDEGVSPIIDVFRVRARFCRVAAGGLFLLLAGGGLRGWG